MQQQHYCARKVHVSDIAFFCNVCERQAFRIQAEMREDFGLPKRQKIPLHIFAAFVKQSPADVLMRLNGRKD